MTAGSRAQRRAKPPAAGKSPPRVKAPAAAKSRAAANGPAALRRVAKGKRPQFYEHEAVDQLFAVVAALTAEVSVAFERIDSLERVLVGEGAVTREVIESYVPGEAAAEARSVQREELIQRVFAVFEAYGAARSR